MNQRAEGWPPQSLQTSFWHLYIPKDWSNLESPQRTFWVFAISVCRLRERGLCQSYLRVCMCVCLMTENYWDMFFVVRSNTSFDFPLGWIKYIVIVIFKIIYTVTDHARHSYQSSRSFSQLKLLSILRFFLCKGYHRLEQLRAGNS